MNIKLDFFRDYRIKLLVSLKKDSKNVRIEKNGVNWCPTLKEVKLYESLAAINKFNEEVKKRTVTFFK